MAVLSRKYRTILKSVSEVVPRVYRLTIGGSNVILLAEEELTLIDTGFPGSSSQVVDLICDWDVLWNELALLFSLTTMLTMPVDWLLIVGDALNKRRDTLRLPPKLASTDLTQAIRLNSKGWPS